ncbi:porin family protein [Parapedobacter soli]|uniref:porin family protein n=1 Tax=Parapedobacter soli TaxID=416955 RepID=UPI0021C827B5|nr:porin family protein [Parapedobacter soli]
MKSILTFVLAVAVGCLTASGQIMQRSTIKGLNLAAGVNMMGWSSDYYELLAEDAGSGYGAGVAASYGITELIEPYLGFTYSSITMDNVDAKSMSMSQLDIGVRLNFLGTIHAWRPFVQAGYSNRTLGMNDISYGEGYVDVRIKAHTPHVGGGVAYFFNPQLSVFAKGLFSLEGKNKEFFDGQNTGTEPDVTAFHVTLGVKFNIQLLLN